jgi:hypothetical protein
MASGEQTPYWLMPAVLAAALAVAAASARPYAGGWNDGSRLATVESLIERHTFVIDESIFVRVPAEGPSPYPPGDVLLRRGTQDKLLIGGHFYSDKPPVPALLMAGVYQLTQWSTGLTARAQPDRFCYWMTLTSSGTGEGSQPQGQPRGSVRTVIRSRECGKERRRDGEKDDVPVHVARVGKGDGGESKTCRERQRERGRQVQAVPHQEDRQAGNDVGENHPRYRAPFLMLSGWGGVLACLAWRDGPWVPIKGSLYWPLQIAAASSLVGLLAWRRRRLAPSLRPAGATTG